MAPQTKLLIVDYGTGNQNSIRRVFERLGVSAIVSSSPESILHADKLILPGVGHFQTAMGNLGRLNLIDALNEVVLIKQRPVLGICLGMELMARSSEEGSLEGLGWLNAEAVRFDFSDKARRKVPHMGWNRICIRRPSRLMLNIAESSEFYFAHSFYLRLNEPQHILNETDYGITFPSAVEQDNIFGVQYHPEKSHGVGAKLLKNFVEI